MGAVYLARDRQLDRKVALKVLTRRSDADSSIRETRLLSEARALALVHHRNVIQVYQVDTSAEPTVIEMEYIDGPTLRTWQVGRGWREIVEAYAEAGDGLAALHRADLIHRDVKPDNLLRDCDGHVKVADLGLAVATSDEPAQGAASTEGTFAGTPAYMAPEVIAGSPADANSDLFGLAVSLFEALYGVLPFCGDTPEELVKAFRAGPAIPRDALPRPRWLRDALDRALGFNPARRHANVAAFTKVLRRGLDRRRRWLLGALLAATVTVLPAIAWLVKPPPLDPCADAGVPFTSIWNPAVRDSIQQRVARHTTPPLERSLGLLVATLDAQTGALADTRVRLCAAESHIDRADASRSAELDLNTQQHACLEHSRRNLAALVATLGVDNPLAPGFAEATEMIEALPTCDDRQRIAHWPLPAQNDDADAGFATALAEAGALEVAGRHDDAERLARRIADSSRENHPLRHAEALYRLGHILGQQHRNYAAYKTLDAARNAAFAVGQDELFCQAAAYQAKFIANVRLDAEASARELDLAEACIQRTGARSVLLHADLTEARGLLARTAGDPIAAIRWHTEALELRRGHLGDQHRDTIKSLHNLANALVDAGRPEEALQRFHEALQARERLLGPDHIDVADILTDLGRFLSLTASDQAPAVLERAATIYARTPEVHHAARARIHTMLASLLLGPVPTPEASLAAAAVHIQQADALLAEDQELGPIHPERAGLLHTQGLLALRQGDFGRARQAYSRATGLLRRHDPLSRDVLDSILMEVEPAYGLEDHASITQHTRSEGQALVEALRNQPVDTRGKLAWYIAESLIQQSAPSEAAIYLQIALDAYTELAAMSSVAELHWQLAQALAVTPDHADEARDHATASLAHYQATGDRPTTATISRWLKRLASTQRPNKSTP